MTIALLKASMVPTDSTSLTAEPRRSELMRIAARLFREQGYHATSMDDIARIMQLRKPSLYHYVQSKEVLLLEILGASVEDILTRTNAAVEEIMAKQVAPEKCLAQLISVELAAMVDHMDEIVLWARSGATLPPSTATIIGQMREIDDLIWRVLTYGTDVGAWRPTNMDSAFQAIRSLLAWFPLWFRQDGVLPVEAVATDYAQYALAILRSEPAP